MEDHIEPARTGSPEAMQSPVVGDHRPASLLCLEPPRLIREHEEAFWTAGRRQIPSFVGNPWDSYEQLLKLGSETWIVLCEDRSTVRVIEGFTNVDDQTDDQESPCCSIPQMRHPNFVDIDKIYSFRGEVFTITEYVGPSIEDLLKRPIEFSEPEIAYIVSQVLAGMRFIWSQKLDHPRISARNILVSRNGEIKINAMDFPSDESHTSANMNSLRVLMFRIMCESISTRLPEENWSAEILSFMEATSWAGPYELSDHVFISRCSITTIPTSFSCLPLCLDRKVYGTGSETNEK